METCRDMINKGDDPYNIKEKHMKEELIRRYMKAGGTNQSLDGFTEVMVQQLIEMGAPQDILDAFRKAMTGLPDLVVPIIEEHYTIEELEALVAFHESPIGKSLTAKAPAIQQAAMKVGQEYAEKVFKELEI